MCLFKSSSGVRRSSTLRWRARRLLRRTETDIRNAATRSGSFLIRRKEASSFSEASRKLLGSFSEASRKLIGKRRVINTTRRRASRPTADDISPSQMSSALKRFRFPETSARQRRQLSRHPRAPSPSALMRQQHDIGVMNWEWL